MSLSLSSRIPFSEVSVKVGLGREPLEFISNPSAIIGMGEYASPLK